MTPIPYTDADVAYVMRDFVSLEDLCHKQGADLATVREHIEQGQLPRPTYVLPDGCEMVPDTRFGGPSSRDRLITDTRERFPTVFETSVSAAAV